VLGQCFNQVILQVSSIDAEAACQSRRPCFVRWLHDVQVDFPFEVVAFMALHLGSAPAQQAKNAVEASNGFSVMACLWRSIGKSRRLLAVA